MKDLKWKPKGIILSGSPYSVYEDDAPRVDPDVFTYGVPVLGICYGLQEIATTFGGKVEEHTHREYGSAKITVKKTGNALADRLFEGIETGPDGMQVWMSHGDQLTTCPPGFITVAETATSPYTAIAHESRPIFGVQFHPEVSHSIGGKEVIRTFVTQVCGIKGGWSMQSFIPREIARIREICGEKGQVIGAVSGGVDSTVAAKIMHEAIGDRFHAIMVDNGVLRMDEAKQVHKMLVEDLGVNLTVIDASDLFLGRLKGVMDPEKKRKIIGNTFIEVFEEEAAKLEKQAEDELAQKGGEAKGKIEWLLQGTLYPDVIESISFKGPSATIKTHHNVGGLLENMKLKLIEPLRELFKDEVRALGRLLDIPAHLVGRHPFPGPGLAIRILGEVTREQVKILQHADKIYIEEIRTAGLYDKISQAFVALLPIQAVGVQGDKRTYDQVVALRAVQTEDFMTADWFVYPPEVLRKISSRITNEVKGVNRVVYDVTSKPPGTRNMPPKAAKEKVVTVKGDEADVSANLKNKVTKTNAQKVLQLLADKGSLSVKVYGKQTIFVYNQDLLPTMPEGSLAILDDELKEVKSAVEMARKTLKRVTQDLNKKLAEPKTEELENEIGKIEAQNATNLKHLLPLRKASGVGTSGEASDGASGPIKQEELNALDSEWMKWRKEWIARKKVYQAYVKYTSRLFPEADLRVHNHFAVRLLDMVQPELSPANRPAFEEEIGVDQETEEANAIEASDLCKPQKSRVVMSGKSAGAIGPCSGKAVVKASAGGVKRKRD
ncbi:GMP synthase (glutamine-hydrolyzing) [Naganishia vaughanmartiniae]|uniref:GMP synthase (Glutamine-hydrolyzing) n=1 Tax=Naganishia vaughanmartiniae TaxID=1424756 RepID=A0ACC2X5A1_9TREE|nr:GMP synthase (glutamine-hydrolyzing) [Naganishia vaughanmartiniae]